MKICTNILFCVLISFVLNGGLAIAQENPSAPVDEQDVVSYDETRQATAGEQAVADEPRINGPEMLTVDPLTQDDQAAIK